MIYSSLDTIPYKLFVKIEKTGDVSLLSDTEQDDNMLSEIWGQIYNEHLSKNQTSESKKIFKINKEIDSLLLMNRLILMICEALKYEFSQELNDLIVSFGYQLSYSDTGTYLGDIQRIEREANAYVIRAENYKNMLPEKKESKSDEYNVDDVMASYSSILGFNIGDFNAITYNAFFGYEKQVSAKLKTLKKQ